MAKKTSKPELDFDIDALVSAIEAINGVDVLDEPIEIDLDNPEGMVNDFIDVMNVLADDEDTLRTIEGYEDIVDLFNEGIPSRFFEGGDEEKGTDSDSDSGFGQLPKNKNGQRTHQEHRALHQVDLFYFSDY
jgi:hypothetical protein